MIPRHNVALVTEELRIPTRGLAPRHGTNNIFLDGLIPS